MFFFGQSLTGLWVGTVSNDSSTVRKDQSYEIALTEYKGKVYGYSRSEFIVDDVLYYIVKRVSGTIIGDLCEVTDEEIISYNFPKLLDKKVKVTNSFRRDKSDSAWYLVGKWKTNATKKYYAVTGRVDLEEEKDLTASKIFPHLEELKLADAVVFYKERKEGQPIVKIARPENISLPTSISTTAITTNSNTIAISDKPTVLKDYHSPSSSTSTIAKNSTGNKNSAPEIYTDLTPVDQPENIQKTETKNIPSTTVDAAHSTKPTAPSTKPVEPLKNNDPENKEQKNLVAATATKRTTDIEKKDEIISGVTKGKQASNPSTLKTNTSSEKNKETAASPIKTTNNQPPVNKLVTSNTDLKEKNTAKQPEVSSTNTISKTEPLNNTSAENKIVGTTAQASILVPEIKTTPVDITLKAAFIAGRKSEFTQQVNFKSDSLQVALYDNGEIDGDTVSVFMNGDVIMAKQGLKSSAIRKTIYITPGQDEFTLVLFAENLGKYPPNTGLLVIRDGDEVYNLRFSSDFQKNTGIVFKRKQ